MSRRRGDKIAITGAYQYNAISNGHPVQRNWHRLKYETALNWLPPKTGDNIIDVGCGSGVLSNIIASQASCMVTGLDGNPDAIAFCNKKYNNKNLHFKHRGFDEIDTEFADHSLHKIFFLECIEHITPEQGAEMLHLFYRLLVPGGQLFISTPNKNSFWPLQEWLLDLTGKVPKLKHEQHEVLYTRKQLLKIAGQVGYSKVKIQSAHFIAPWLSVLPATVTSKIERFELQQNWLPGSLLFALLTK